VIDYAGLRLRVPQVAYDLPAGGRRLMQDAEATWRRFFRVRLFPVREPLPGACPEG
jgi:hypothetical protein